MLEITEGMAIISEPDILMFDPPYGTQPGNYRVAVEVYDSLMERSKTN